MALVQSQQITGNGLGESPRPLLRLGIFSNFSVDYRPGGVESPDPYNLPSALKSGGFLEMKTMLVWTQKPGTLRETVSRFLAGQGNPPAGVTMLGRWHSIDFSTGFTLYEYTDPAVLYEAASTWADVLNMQNFIVVEDAEVGPILAKTFKS
jgi:hypothetical protein